jgi:uncharacterized membrane protein
MSRFFVALVLSVFVVSADAQAAQWWTICNRTAEDLDVAIAYFHPSEEWFSEGWWGLKACGGCARVMNLADSDRPDHYFYAVTTTGDERVGGDVRHCVTPHPEARPWTGQSGAKCNDQDISVGFRVEEIEYFDEDFKTNISETVAGRTCP